MHPTLNHPLEQVSLQSMNSFGLSAKAALFSTLADEADALAFAKLSRQKQPLIWGGGSNILLTQDYPGWVGKMDIKGIETLSTAGTGIHLRVGAGEHWHDFVRFSLNQGWFGLENLALIPGTVGAAPIQNIGAYGVELKDHCTGVDAIDTTTGKTVFLDTTACQFGYRSSFFKTQARGAWIITHVHFSLSLTQNLKLNYGNVKETLLQQGKTNPTAQDVFLAVVAIRQSKLPDPARIGNAGSFFKNPTVSEQEYNQLLPSFPKLPGFKTASGIKIPAAWLIEACGWKGFRKGDAGVHHKQALVLVNHGQASGQALWQLSKEIQASVAQKFNIALEAEVNVL
jgi:UDP-N-acetylmuramate dehydrogenase